MSPAATTPPTALDVADVDVVVPPAVVVVVVVVTPPAVDVDVDEVVVVALSWGWIAARFLSSVRGDLGFILRSGCDGRRMGMC
jgi:hypothetical protein